MASPPSFYAVALEVLPLAVGAAVSPMVLIVQLLTLTQPGAGLRRGWSYAAGTAVVVSLWMAVGLLVASALPKQLGGPDPLSAGLRLTLALLLLALGAAILAKPRSPAAKAATQEKTLAKGTTPLARAFGLGLATMALNLTSLVLVIPASEDLARAGLPGLLQGVLVLAVVLITLAPAIGPPLALALAGAPARIYLKKIGSWAEEHQRSINASLCFGFAILLGLSGLGRL